MDAEGIQSTSNDIWRKTDLEKYEEWPPQLQSVTYAEFMAERLKTEKRRKPVVLRCRDYSINDPVYYKREHVMLYHPYRRVGYLGQRRIRVHLRWA
ncbi:hypothetical protein V5799_005497 [Amblyomma americanum]|uniref:Uncharacterized protein n=1 Tax=Amblyomma americanum TaxID=6943 RepID=A0AAQ4DZ35_AMBAM